MVRRKGPSCIVGQCNAPLHWWSMEKALLDLWSMAKDPLELVVIIVPPYTGIYWEGLLRLVVSGGRTLLFSWSFENGLLDLWLVGKDPLAL